METKKLLLLLSSYITCAFLMYACLKSNNGRTEKIDNAYMTTYINKLDEVLEKLIENNENKTSPPIIVNKITPNNNVTVIVNISADEIAKHINVAPASPAKANRDTFYFGKYKIPQKFLNKSKISCLDNEMDISYFQTCFNKHKESIENGEPTKMLEMLIEFMTLDPAVEISSECMTPPPLPDVKCEDYTNLYGDEARKAEKEHKMGVLIQLGYDVDLLEVYLWEVYDVVDKFFITESVYSHSNDQKRKPLIWDKVKDTPRFKRFADKVVHFVVDDAGRTIPDGNIWASEDAQERLRWEKFKEWNEKHKYFEDDDLLGFGDTDEIPSRNALAVLKQCSGNLDHLDIGITFFFGGHENAFRSDFPKSGYPYTLGEPTFFTLKDALTFRGKYPYPNKNRGQSPKFLLGGAHISPYPYAPFVMNKALVATERRKMAVTSGSMEELEDYYKNEAVNQFRSRISNVNQVMNRIKDHYYIPWIMKCVPDRYPSFFGKRDQRLYYPPCFFDFEC